MINCRTIYIVCVMGMALYTHTCTYVFLFAEIRSTRFIVCYYRASHILGWTSYTGFLLWLHALHVDIHVRVHMYMLKKYSNVSVEILFNFYILFSFKILLHIVSSILYECVSAQSRNPSWKVYWRATFPTQCIRKHSKTLHHPLHHQEKIRTWGLWRYF